MPEANECAETYNACMRSRGERIKRVIAENPDLSTRKLAALAGVAQNAIVARKKQREQRCSTKNSVEPNPLKDDEKTNVVRLPGPRGLMRPDTDYRSHPTVRTIELALIKCTRPELAYVIYELIPEFKTVLKRRRDPDDYRRLEKENDPPQKDHTAHGKS